MEISMRYFWGVRSLLSHIFEMLTCEELERSHLFSKNRYAILKKASSFRDRNWSNAPVGLKFR
jgi:hypothetical protein